MRAGEPSGATPSRALPASPPPGQAGPHEPAPAPHRPVPMVMLPGWGTVLLSKVFSRAATPNSFRSRSSSADSGGSERRMSRPAS